MNSDFVFGVGLLGLAALQLITWRLAENAKSRIRAIAMRGGLADAFEVTNRELRGIRWASGVLLLGFMVLALWLGIQRGWQQPQVYTFLGLSIAVALAGTGWQSWIYWRLLSKLNDNTACRPVWTLFASTLVSHTIGGHYTFANVPFGFVTELFGFERNHFDRIGHFSIGFYAYPLIELLTRKRWCGLVLASFFGVFFIMSKLLVT